jgi:hypothetical protein
LISRTFKGIYETGLAALFILHASVVYAANTNANKRFCAPSIADNSAVSLEQFSQELEANNISVVPGNVVQPQNLLLSMLITK